MKMELGIEIKFVFRMEIMCKSLEIRALLKLNRNVCRTGVTMTFTY